MVLKSRVGVKKKKNNCVSVLLLQCWYLPMSLDNMNKLQLVPKKDYTANRLNSAVLQMSAGTHLILDETALQPGQLETTGKGFIVVVVVD